VVLHRTIPGLILTSFTVFYELAKKHPKPSPATPMNLIDPNTTTLLSCHPIIFDCLDSDLICRIAVHIEGSAGPLGVDALG